ncbi:MAG: four helix bundle protein [Alphaproteobacteria bacterium]|nr:four helix bundle protein [Alphaproteobacteria bacterium]
MAVRSYKDLLVWQKSMDMVTDVYRLTALLPPSELYGLTNQLRRAAISVPSNLAEGSSRRSTKEFLRFVNIASGSLAEMETQLQIAANLALLRAEQISALSAKSEEISKMLHSLHRTLSQKTVEKNNVVPLDSKL